MSINDGACEKGKVKGHKKSYANINETFKNYYKSLLWFFLKKSIITHTYN